MKYNYLFTISRMATDFPFIDPEVKSIFKTQRLKISIVGIGAQKIFGKLSQNRYLNPKYYGIQIRGYYDNLKVEGALYRVKIWLDEVNKELKVNEKISLRISDCNYYEQDDYRSISDIVGYIGIPLFHDTYDSRDDRTGVIIICEDHYYS